ncbi:AraC family transcriptional regulator [Paraburkholderia lacunae]|uniref:AraC family transcriptional regulator n=1 Tax=Paraburkholderia lacunae TaxID=2211104 RepID=A0A370NAY7_9BURK|nr:AraC family transcriptional regulator [Paraburkholderia lacunae]RDK02735.1 AraC family transcriptional regulator [Paraburkholderia lacunae]
MQVAMMLYEGFRLLEVTGPMDVFHEANRLSGATLYEQHLVGPSPRPVACSNGVAVGTTESLSDVPTSFDIVVVPGSPAVGPEPEHRELVAWLRDAGSRVRRLASVSNGAFLIARAGLADHRALTTHWRDAQRLSTEFPLVHVISHQSYLKDGNLYSSRGVSDGIRVALALVGEDLGEEFARSVTQSLSRQRSWPKCS